MKRDAILPPLNSSFLSCERDTETILRKLFVESKQHSQTLKRLLIISNKDCLDNITNPEYEKVKDVSIKQLLDEGYIITSPVLKNEEHEKLKAAIVISFTNFTASSNPEFRDCIVGIDVLCNLDCWDLNNYQQRPFKILGYIDGILNKSKLSGIGKLEFVGCTGPIINEQFGMYSMMYKAVHGSEDSIPDEQYNGI